MLRSVRELQRRRVKTAEGGICGRIHDFYFDDRSWEVRHIVLTLEPRHTAQCQVLLEPGMVQSLGADSFVQLNISGERIDELPLASSVLPVCKQYATLSYASPASPAFRGGGSVASPHLRSAGAVTKYRVEFAGEFSGSLVDFLVEDEGWTIRYLGVEQTFERKRLKFFVFPQSVERFGWAAQRVLLRELQPVEVDSGGGSVEMPDQDVA